MLWSTHFDVLRNLLCATFVVYRWLYTQQHNINVMFECVKEIIHTQLSTFFSFRHFFLRLNILTDTELYATMIKRDRETQIECCTIDRLDAVLWNFFTIIMIMVQSRVRNQNSLVGNLLTLTYLTWGRA